VSASFLDWKDPLAGDGPESAVVISSRARLARNLANAPFPDHAKPGEQKMILESVFEAAKDVPSYKKGLALRLADLPALERNILQERHLVSKHLAESGGPRGLLLDAANSLPAMVNEEDHLRLSALEPGLNLERACQRLNEADDALGKKLAWAYHDRWGYLTACPTNCGTGQRLSARLHLPALALTGALAPVLQGLQRLGLTVRGSHGEGTQAAGDIFQISNASTLGRSEEETAQYVTRLVKRVVRQETQARDEIMSGPRRLETEDGIYRAYGLLTQARKTTIAESLTLLSRLRLGVHLGLKFPFAAGLINQLMTTVQPAHIQRWAGKTAAADVDERRAALLRKALTDGTFPDRTSYKE